MATNRLRPVRSSWRNDYGMALVLLAICGFFSVMTWSEQHPTSASAARSLASSIASQKSAKTGVLIVVRDSEDDALFADELERVLREQGVPITDTVKGQPADVRRAVTNALKNGRPISVFAANQVTAAWSVYDPLRERYPELAAAKLMKPEPYYWPNFLKTENLLNVANQIAVIALIAVGMTAVIVTGGIDLSVGSLIALSAVVTARVIRDVFGAEAAGPAGMIIASLLGIVACAGAGVFSGLMVTLFQIPSFIATVGVMLVSSGIAYMLADGQSINQVPDSFIRLGRGADLLHIPNAVVLMFALYVIAHVTMRRTVFGRHVYAVGGNAEAARLSGVPVRSVLIAVYTICGGLAGLGGVVMASQLKSGAPTYGQMYELYVIAAVVVGGTSLSGGRGHVFGTLIGAFIIAVIQNGMNLMGVESYTQKIVLGMVILGAVLADRIKQRISKS